jgi:hypothetical protein
VRSKIQEAVALLREFESDFAVADCRHKEPPEQRVGSLTMRSGASLAIRGGYGMRADFGLRYACSCCRPEEPDQVDLSIAARDAMTSLLGTLDRRASSEKLRSGQLGILLTKLVGLPHVQAAKAIGVSERSLRAHMAEAKLVGGREG